MLPQARCRDHAAELESPAYEQRTDRLAELNVVDSVARIAVTPIMRSAWDAGRRVEIHGMIYALADGRLHQLDCSIVPS